MVPQLFDESADGSVLLRLHVQPGAGRTQVTGRHGDALKVKVAAPPEQGLANQACARLVAELAGLPATDVELAGGGTSRSKRFKLTGIEAGELSRLLDLALVEAGGNAQGRSGVRRAPKAR